MSGKEYSVERVQKRDFPIVLIQEESIHIKYAQKMRAKNLSHFVKTASLICIY